MALRLMVDVNVGKIVEDWLKASGFDVIAVRDIDPSLADNLVLDRGLVANRLVVTMDKDFGELVYRLGQGHRAFCFFDLRSIPVRRRSKRWIRYCGLTLNISMITSASTRKGG